VRARGGKDVTRDDREIVSAVHRALADKVGHERVAVWFGRGVRMEPCGKTLRIAAADTFRLDYLRRAFRADLIEAARIVSHLLEITLDSIEFIVDPAAAATISGGQPHQQSPTERPHQEGTPTERTRVQEAPTMERQPHLFRPVEGKPVHENAEKPRLPRRQFASLADFVASEPNRIALCAAQTAATRPGVYTPLTIVGPPGSGKTHLLEGIWRHVRMSRTLARVIYLSAEQFTNQFIDALRNTGAPNFRRKMRDVEMLLIDDLQFFAGKQSTLVELVHTVDTLLRSGRQVVFASDRPPSELRSLGPEIVARLAGGLICTLQPADCAARLGILHQFATRQSMNVPPDVLQWLAAEHSSGDARQLAGALNRLQAASDAHEQPLDLDFAQASLADLIHAGRRPVRLPDIVDAVCDVLGVGADELQSAKKSASVAVPRMLVMFLARKWTRAALSEISRTLGRRSHSTVLSAQHKVTEWLAAGKTVPLALGHCQLEDAIQRIEAQLRVG
jgi:chromosomal replication initiator protein